MKSQILEKDYEVKNAAINIDHQHNELKLKENDLNNKILKTEQNLLHHMGLL